MTFPEELQTVDVHTAGEPTRVVVGGVPEIKGSTIAQKKEHLEKSVDHLRTALMLEPRGHKDMFGSILLNPTDPQADLGIIFMDGGGYLNMCGHGTIGAVTVAIDRGMVPIVEPTTKVLLETPAGLVEAEARVENHKAKSVSFTNVPSFLAHKDHKINFDGKEVVFDISFGGSFFAIVHAKQLGVEIRPENTAALRDVALRLRDLVNKDVAVRHPTLSHINKVDLVEIYDEPTHPEAGYKNVVIFGRGQVDRSPCGTGTCAKLAALHAKGQIKQGESFVHESILGTLFRAEIVGTGKVGDYDAIIPKITGTAYITGYSRFVIDEADPLKYGFSL